MTFLQLALLSGSLLMAGAIGVFWSLRPAPPSLESALAQLALQPVTLRTQPMPAADRPGEWLPAPLMALLSGRIGAADADLAITGTTREQLAVRKVSAALAGFFLPAVAGLFLQVVGGPVPFVIPAGLGLVFAALLWVLPNQDLKEKARLARNEFRTNLESFLLLVAGERSARGSVDQAIAEASSVSGSVPFIRLRQTIRRATLAGRSTWEELEGLALELNIPELANAANIAKRAGDGAATYKALLAEARTMRHTDLTDQRALANTESEKMSRPLTLLVAGLTLFVLIPFALRIGGIT